MKKWQTGLWAMTVLGAVVLSPSAAARAYPKTEKTSQYPMEIIRPASASTQNRPVLSPTISQLGHQIQIVIEGSFRKEELVTAIWSEKGGAEAINWYTYEVKSSQAELSFDSTDDLYHIKTYMKSGDDLILVHQVDVQGQSIPEYQIENKGAHQYQISVSHVASDINCLYIPVWSETAGQDDLIWYEAKALGDGEFTLTFPLANHSYDVGAYQVHLYGKKQDGRLIGLLATDGFSVEEMASQEQFATVNTGENTYPIGQCTWGVKEQVAWIGNNWGNAKDWLHSAIASGFQVGEQAMVGAVAVWTNDGVIDGMTYGHVAYVTEVDGSVIRVRESNYAGQMTIQDYRGWFNPKDSLWGGGVYYIYPPNSQEKLG